MEICKYTILIIYLTRKIDNYKQLINSISSDVIKSLVEIAYNILKGSIHISRNQTLNLKANKQNLKILINKKVSIKVKRAILIDNHMLVKSMLNVIFS